MSDTGLTEDGYRQDSMGNYICTNPECESYDIVLFGGEGCCCGNIEPC